jgi:hypothetical protein
MDDLGNERRAVVGRVKALNLEPVNAEGLLPNGATSWSVITNEIASSHLFVLILGERYGWIPTEGYGAPAGSALSLILKQRSLSPSACRSCLSLNASDTVHCPTPKTQSRETISGSRLRLGQLAFSGQSSTGPMG